MRIDLRVPACRSLDQVAAFARRCEEAGLDGVGLIDSQLVVRDTFATMAVLARETRRLRLSASVTNPVTRHPAVLASAIATAAELAPGRVEIVLGSGYSAARTIGRPPATRHEMREAALTVMGLLRGERVTFGGTTSHLAFRPPVPVPLYVAGTSPRMIELGAEIADGVLLQVGARPEILATARRHVEEGARRGGRSLEAVRVAVCFRAILTTDVEAALEADRPNCATWLIEKHRARWLALAGIPIPAPADIPAAVHAVYPDLLHAEDRVAARKATAFLAPGTLSAIADVVGVVGPAERLFDRLRELEAGGVGHVYLITPATYEFPHEVLEAFARRR